MSVCAEYIITTDCKKSVHCTCVSASTCCGVSFPTCPLILDALLHVHTNTHQVFTVGLGYLARYLEVARLAALLFLFDVVKLKRA